MQRPEGINAVAIDSGAKIEVHLFSDADTERMAKVVRRALGAGHRVVSREFTEWWTWVEITNPGASGSGVYNWDKAGERIQSQIYRNRVARGSEEIKREKLRTVYRRP